MAICGGADLVLELPTIYSISSAENFASGGIKLLDCLKIVDSVSFGAETNDFGVQMFYMKNQELIPIF